MAILKYLTSFPGVAILSCFILTARRTDAGSEAGLVPLGSLLGRGLTGKRSPTGFSMVMSFLSLKYPPLVIWDQLHAGLYWTGGGLSPTNDHAG